MRYINALKLHVSIDCSRRVRYIELCNLRVMAKVKCLYTRVTHVKNLQFWVLREVNTFHACHVKAQTLQIWTACWVCYLETDSMVSIKRTQIREVLKCEVRRDMSNLWDLQYHKIRHTTNHQWSSCRERIILQIDNIQTL